MTEKEGVLASVHTVSATVEQFEIPLDEDKEATNREFNGTTLHLNNVMDNAGADIPGVEFSQRVPADVAANNNHGDRGIATVNINGDENGLTRDRPFSASMISRRTTGSTASRTSMSPIVYQSDMNVQHFFSHREGMYDKMMKDCISTAVKLELDGEVKGVWILIQIDHWDRENEKVFIVSETSLLIVTYDFIKERVIQTKRILLDMITTVQIGDIVYPPKSLMYARQHGGVRLTWGDDMEVSFGQRWNPWCNTLPFITVAHHPILYNTKEHETVIYNVDDFFETILDAIEKAHKHKNMTVPVKLVEEPILVENYGSLYSMIYNQSWLGYNRDRNGISF